MAGPGGGGRSGGGGRGFGMGGGGHHGGGGFGGGRPGGMHHGPHHPPPFRPFMGMPFGRRYYYGGGCLGGLLSMTLLPILAIVLVGILVVGFVGTGISEVAQGGSIVYNETALQDYANQQYTEAFAGTAFEDNLLIVVLTDESNVDYVYIAWVGDHVDYAISDMLGDNTTVLGVSMEKHVSSTDYRYNLDTGLARVLQDVGQRIKALGLESNFTCQEEEDRSPAQSVLINNTNLPMSEGTVNEALTQFTTETGIPCVIVVEEAEEVFGRNISVMSIVCVVVAAVVVVLIVMTIVKKKRAATAKDTDDRKHDRYRDPY